jgi:hypothetical protein
MPRDVDLDGFGRIRDDRMDDAKPGPMPRRVARFLDEFALGGCERGLAGIELPGRKLQERAVLRIPELAHGDEPSIVQHRDHQHRTGMHDVFAHGLTAVGQPHAVAANVEQRAGIDLLSGQSLLDQRIGSGAAAELGTRVGRGSGHNQSLAGRKSV